MGDFQKFIERVCNDTAVYWEFTGTDGYGKGVYKSPVDISCRWVTSQEVVRTDQGKEVVSEAQVLVTQDLVEQSMLYHGSLSDLDSSEEAEPLKAEAYEIIRFRKVPSIDGNDYKRKAYL